MTFTLILDLCHSDLDISTSQYYYQSQHKTKVRPVQDMAQGPISQRAKFNRMIDDIVAQWKIVYLALGTCDKSHSQIFELRSIDQIVVPDYQSKAEVKLKVKTV